MIVLKSRFRQMRAGIFYAGVRNMSTDIFLYLSQTSCLGTDSNLAATSGSTSQRPRSVRVFRKECKFFSFIMGRKNLFFPSRS